MSWREFTRLKAGDRVLWKPDGSRGRVDRVRARDPSRERIGEVSVVWDGGSISWLDDVSDYLFLVKEGSG